MGDVIDFVIFASYRSDGTLHLKGTHMLPVIVCPRQSPFIDTIPTPFSLILPLFRECPPKWGRSCQSPYTLVKSQRGGIHAEEEFNPWIRVIDLFWVNDSNFCPNLPEADNWQERQAAGKIKFWVFLYRVW